MEKDRISYGRGLCLIPFGAALWLAPNNSTSPEEEYQEQLIRAMDMSTRFFKCRQFSIMIALTRDLRVNC